MKIKLPQRMLISALAFVVLVNSLGSFVLVYAETGIHRLVACGAAPEKTETLVLDKSDFAALAWIGQQDFIYKDKVYDCENISSAAGKIRIACCADAEETSLKNSLSKNFDADSKSTPANKPLKVLFKTFPVFSENNAPSLLASSFSGTRLYSTACNLQLLPAASRLNSPPPKTA